MGPEVPRTLEKRQNKLGKKSKILDVWGVFSAPGAFRGRPGTARDGPRGPPNIWEKSEFFSFWDPIERIFSTRGCQKSWASTLSMSGGSGSSPWWRETARSTASRKVSGWPGWTTWIARVRSSGSSRKPGRCQKSRARWLLPPAMAGREVGSVAS